MNETCICGRSRKWDAPNPCPTSDPMGCDYTDTIDCYGRAWEREKARADAAEAREATLAAANAALADSVTRCAGIEAALAAARRECEGLRKVVTNLIDTMEMQEKRESGAFHITGEVMWGIWSDAKSQARAALAAPATGEEGER